MIQIIKGVFSTFHCSILFDLLFCRYLLLIVNYHFFLSNDFFSCVEVSIWFFYDHWFSKVKQILHVRNKLNVLMMYEPLAVLLDPNKCRCVFSLYQLPFELYFLIQLQSENVFWIILIILISLISFMSSNVFYLGE